MPTKTNKPPYHIAIGTVAKLGNIALGGLGEVLQQRKLAKEQGQDYSFGQGLKDFGAGSLAKATSGQVDLTSEQDPNQLAAMENAEEQGPTVAPYGMVSKKPFKALSPYTASYSAYNQSAKEAGREEQMKQVSGANGALQANAFIGALRNAQENNKPTFKVGGEVYDNKDYDPNRD